MLPPKTFHIAIFAFFVACLGITTLGAPQKVQAQAPTQTPTQAPVPPPAPAPAPAAIPPPQPVSPLWEKISQRVTRAHRKNLRPIVVLELDRALLDPRPRELAILKAYGSQELATVRPKAAQKIAALTLASIQGGVRKTLSAAGIQEDAVINNAAVFRAQNFFSGTYLHVDEPLLGAVAWVRSLYSKGARIIYLSRRNHQEQLVGTMQTLHKLGFPIGIRGSELIMRPKDGMSNAVFLQGVTTYLRGSGKVVAILADTAANANIHRRAYAKAKVLLMAASQAPNPGIPLLPGIARVYGFPEAGMPSPTE